MCPELRAHSLINPDLPTVHHLFNGSINGRHRKFVIKKLKPKVEHVAAKVPVVYLYWTNIHPLKAHTQVLSVKAG